MYTFRQVPASTRKVFDLRVVATLDPSGASPHSCSEFLSVFLVLPSRHAQHFHARVHWRSRVLATIPVFLLKEYPCCLLSAAAATLSHITVPTPVTCATLPGEAGSCGKGPTVFAVLDHSHQHLTLLAWHSQPTATSCRCVVLLHCYSHCLQSAFQRLPFRHLSPVRVSQAPPCTLQSLQ